MNLQFRNKNLTETQIFSELQHFLLRKNNRFLTNDEVVEKTGVSHELIHKWVKSGKLKSTIFPNLGAPCERCGKITPNTRICYDCANYITTTLEQDEKNKQWFKEIQQNRKSTYNYKNQVK